MCARAGGGLDAGAAAGIVSAAFNADSSVFTTMKVAMTTATMMTVILAMTGTLWAMDESEYEVEGDDRRMDCFFQMTTTKVGRVAIVSCLGARVMIAMLMIELTGAARMRTTASTQWTRQAIRVMLILTTWTTW